MQCPTYPNNELAQTWKQYSVQSWTVHLQINSVMKTAIFLEAVLAKDTVIENQCNLDKKQLYYLKKMNFHQG